MTIATAIYPLWRKLCIIRQVSRDANINDGMRTALIEAAARLIATEGAGALTLRRVTEEVGTSTMAVYTHFGGMPELRRSVRREGFARLAEELARVDESDDPVADLAMLGVAYNANATSNPHMYQAMHMGLPLDEADAGAQTETFKVLTAAVQRCIAAGRFQPANAAQLAIQFWSVGHGIMTWQLAGMLTPEDALACAAGGVLSLFTGWGDDRDAARRSLIDAGRRVGPQSARAPTQMAAAGE
jgi:AcrR family transcriptional regulator